jgi:polysaccharide pyruvyl transferase WcaK-like protein
MVYAIGAGPLDNPEAQAAVRDALEQAAVVTVREKRAQRVLENAGVHREIIVTADPALLIKPEPLPRGLLRREGLEGRRRIIGMSVREPGVAAPGLDEKIYHGLLANAADFMVDRFDAEVVFVPMEPVLDTQHSHAVIAKMLRAQRATVLKGEYTPGQLLSWIGKFDFALGMRLHFLIFSAIAGTPFVALPYAGKVSGFLEALDLVAPPLNLVNPGRLIAYLDESWDRRRSMRTRIGETLPPLQERARESHRIALELLTGEKARAHIKAA